MVTVCYTAAIVVFVSHLMLLAKALPAAGTRKQQEEYLMRYAYMGPKSMNLDLAELRNPEDVFRMAVEKFQMMAGLNVTGTVNNETQRTMEMPRCGMADEDVMGVTAKKRRRRYAASGYAWGKTSLTFRINNLTPDLNPNTVRTDIKTALLRWKEVSTFTFNEVTSQSTAVDININFASGNHQDGSPFDGPGGVLAHAYFPQGSRKGQVHFDEDERWSSGSSSGGTDLLQVAIHEFGHTLGLAHSNVKEAIMYPFYGGYIPNVRLHSDDIAGIKYIYGRNRGSAGDSGPAVTARSLPPPPTSPPPPPPTRIPRDDPICRNFTLNAFFPAEGDWHLFKGAQYYRLRGMGIVSGYPKPIGSEWPGLPNDIDTAFYDDGFVYFFKGNSVWRYMLATRQLQASYPQRIADRFIGLPNNLDAAFIWSGNGKLYFTQGDRYYRVSNFRSSVSSVDRHYPSALRYWRGLPTRVDAAFSLRGRTYFIRGEDFYRFNDVRFKVDDGFPIKMGRIWMLCPNGYSVDSNAKMMAQVMEQSNDQFIRDSVTTSDVASNLYFTSLRLPITVNVLVTLSLLFSA